jgi:hypothetical protein
MALEAGDLREQITLQAHDGATDTFVDLPEDPQPWAASQSLGDERYTFRLRWRPDLFGYRDTQWAMRILWRNRVLEVVDVSETDLGQVLVTAQGIHVIVSDLSQQAPRTLHPWP